MNRYCLRLSKCAITVLSVFTSHSVFAASAETMGQGIMLLALYTLGLHLPIPYCFLLMVYSLFLWNRSSATPQVHSVISIITLVFVALFVLFLFLQQHIYTPSYWDVIFSTNVVAGIIIVILGIYLVKMGKIIVLFTMLPLGVILLVFIIVLINLSISIA